MTISKSVAINGFSGVVSVVPPELLRGYEGAESDRSRPAKIELPVARLVMVDEEEFEATLFSPEYIFVTPENVAAAHRMNMQVVPWTVDKEADWQKMADAGVDAIITDDPASLIAWLKARGLR